jgi:hypothetical protein
MTTEKMDWRRRAEALAAWMEGFQAKTGHVASNAEIKAANAAGELRGLSNDTAIRHVMDDIETIRAEILEAQHGHGYQIEGDK